MLPNIQQSLVICGCHGADEHSKDSAPTFNTMLFSCGVVLQRAAAIDA
jgi:hypothetical protein